jgi:hypothetical protein
MRPKSLANLAMQNLHKFRGELDVEDGLSLGEKIATKGKALGLTLGAAGRF